MRVKAKKVGEWPSQGLVGAVAVSAPNSSYQGEASGVVCVCVEVCIRMYVCMYARMYIPSTCACMCMCVSVVHHLLSEKCQTHYARISAREG